PSSLPMVLTKKQVKKEMERLNMELQLMTSQRNELQNRLIFITEGTMENRLRSGSLPLAQEPIIEDVLTSDRDVVVYEVSGALVPLPT
ncbi:hypothetical protein A6R68_01857, partial [Neotoma lepida]